jgi:trimeric autotransporter adhesin
VTPGTAFRDRIRVTGLEGRTTAVAQLFGPFSSRAAATCTPGFRVASKSLRVGNGTTRTPVVRIHAPGVYTWRVTLQANPRNQSATHACGQIVETTVVAKPKYRAPAIKGGFTGSIGSSDRAAAAARRAAIRIRMPSIGMNAPIVPEGIVGRHMVLPVFTKVGWLKKSDSFGDKIGSVVVGGHVSSRRDRPGALFRLKNARKGNLVTVTKAGKTYTYKVSSRAIFSRHRAIPKKYFKTTGKPRLVIVSCVHKKLLPHGRFTYTKYIIVVAKQIS